MPLAMSRRGATQSHAASEKQRQAHMMCAYRLHGQQLQALYKRQLLLAERDLASRGVVVQARHDALQRALLYLRAQGNTEHASCFAGAAL